MIVPDVESPLLQRCDQRVDKFLVVAAVGEHHLRHTAPETGSGQPLTRRPVMTFRNLATGVNATGIALQRWQSGSNQTIFIRSIPSRISSVVEQRFCKP